MKKIKIALPMQILMALVLGVIFGIFGHEYVKYISWAGVIFLRFLKMIVVPIVFSSMVVGVAGMGNSGGLGRIAGKTFSFYIITTLIAAFIGMLFVNILEPGVGSTLIDQANGAAQAASANKISLGERLITIVPDNIFRSLTEG
ncbi:MAG: cation:dicarboxylase symporter family transporter, partial [Bacteroidales bacterium]|nr:cation:dicarboxylase symporter family transporter [Bacteroidales bacterium]